MSTPQQPPILDLPDELLTGILRQAAVLPYWHLAAKTGFAIYDLKICARLSTVCRRFYSNSLKFSYQSIHLGDWLGGWRKAPTIASVTHIHNIMRTNPAIAGYCQNLSINPTHASDKANKALAYFANHVVPLLTDVNTLSFDGPLSAIRSDQSWLVLRQAARYMTKLARLELKPGRGKNGLEIFPLVNGAEFGALKTVRLCYAYDEHETLQTPETKNANFEHLILKGFRAKAHHLNFLINWPSALTTFVFRSFSHSELHQRQMALPEILHMLQGQKETLKIIKICSVGARDPVEDILDTSDFTALEELTVSRWHFGESHPVFHWTDVALVAAPNLKRLTYDARRDEYIGRREKFTSDDETWIRRLVQGALASNFSLPQLEIICEPGISGAYVHPVSPWDRARRLREEFGPQGVCIEYNLCNTWNDEHD
ncbi:unnamed protein product [Clonostachys rosea]|uniref:F-box domain-containing protein n=1 Tax=Bionectria ochroleuca TaxID=29856 RepID=A0ABY6UC88_BIOOC|nr:unnamed protein product [Clonostachys rosea]